MKIGSRAALSAATTLLGMTALLGTTACKSNTSEQSQTVTLTGAGSTFVYPVMTRWTQDYQAAHQGVQINYQSIGSGGGIQQVKQGTVDFGASDAALDDQKLAAMKPMLQMPESAGPVCVTYNLPELKEPLRLSPEALAAIFLGQIKNWQDPAIKRDNPGVSLPATTVVVVHRADGSGTSNIFTTYLAEVSKEWASNVGKGTQVSWPAGNGGKGSEGVTGQVQQAPGAIGYVELTYAQQNHLPVALIKNQAGKYIAPNPESTSAAISGFAEQLAQDARTPIVNAPATATNAYPISGLTFLLIPKDGQGQAKRQALKNFVKYIVTDGQGVAGSLNYAPLPDAVKQNDLKLLDSMTASGQPLQ